MSLATIPDRGQVLHERRYASDADYRSSIMSLTQFARVRLIQFGVSGQDADDLAQDVMLSLLRQLPNFEVERGSMENWITGFAKLAAKGWVRQKVRRQQREVPLELAPGVPAEADKDHSVTGAIHGALSKLADGDREMVTMRFTQGLSSKQIAEKMGVSDMAVRKRLSRAIERVRRDNGLREALYS